MNEPTKIRGRIIRDCARGRIDEIVEADETERSELAGDVDFHPDSVAYAEQIAREKIDAAALAAEDAWLA